MSLSMLEHAEFFENMGGRDCEQDLILMRRFTIGFYIIMLLFLLWSLYLF